MRGFVLLFALSCALMINPGANAESANPLERVLRSGNPKISQVAAHIDQHEVQIIYSTIDRTDDGVVFTDYTFGVDEQRYFYPASTVKFPFALLALEKLGRDPRFDRDTPFQLEGEDFITSIAQEITKVFAVSDNEAANRLFEYLGQDYMQKALEAKGLNQVRLSHRLSAPDSANPVTRPLIFSVDGIGPVRVAGTVNAPVTRLKMDRLEKGRGFYQDGELVNEPMDFSEKNYLSLPALHSMLKRLVFPQAYAPDERFELTESDRKFVLQAMAALPAEAGYDAIEYPDAYVKFLMFGDTSLAIPGHIRIFNKVGNAYGYLTDSAYITDEKNQLEFLLTATIHVNENQVFNDDTYEYDQVGKPFLAELGRQIHAIELTRRKLPGGK